MSPKYFKDTAQTFHNDSKTHLAQTSHTDSKNTFVTEVSQTHYSKFHIVYSKQYLAHTLSETHLSQKCFKHSAQTFQFVSKKGIWLKRSPQTFHLVSETTYRAGAALAKNVQTTSDIA